MTYPETEDRDQWTDDERVLFFEYSLNTAKRLLIDAFVEIDCLTGLTAATEHAYNAATSSIDAMIHAERGYREWTGETL